VPTYIISENSTAQNASGTLYSGVVDAKIKENSATTNYGSGFDLEPVAYSSGDHTATLIRFDGISNISASENVTSATLYGYLEADAGTAYDVTIEEMLQAWTEAGCTWNTYDGSNNWNTAGALGAGTDYDSTGLGTTSVGTTTGQYYALTLSAAHIEDIIDGTISSDEGFKLTQSSSINGFLFKVLTSSEGADGQRPELVLVTTAGGGGATTRKLVNGGLVNNGLVNGGLAA